MTKRRPRSEKRNQVERDRQTDIDDEIQKLMCFLPNRSPPQKMSRNQVLQELYEIALKLKKEEAETQEKN